jgi:hypothetical protein
MCCLWAVFCVRVQHVITGNYLIKDIWVIVLNFLFAPISLIIGINRIPKDFRQLKEDKEAGKNSSNT